MPDKNSITTSHAVVRADMDRLAGAELPWEKLRNKTVMVSGCGGFLASYLIQALLALNTAHRLSLRVIGVARNMLSVQKRLAHLLNNPSFSVVFHDVTSPAPDDFPLADFIVHAASQASPKYYGTDPVGTLLANTVGTQHLLQHAVRSSAQRFLFFSSGEVYGVARQTEPSISELDYGYLDPMQIRSCYAESKRMGETMCCAWAHQYGLHASVVRPFHTYGPGMASDDGRVFADFVADVVAGRDILLKSDGLAQRTFCYIADATLGFLTVLLLGEKAQAYNIANPQAEVSMRDLATRVAGLFPERGVAVRFDIPVASNAYLSSPIARSCPSIAKVRALGWAPQTGIEDGFRRTIQSYLA
jgi:UDP-glucuronate decarboxylase